MKRPKGDVNIFLVSTVYTKPLSHQYLNTNNIYTISSICNVNISVIDTFYELTI